MDKTRFPVVAAVLSLLLIPSLATAQVSVELRSPNDPNPIWQFTEDDGLTDPDDSLATCTSNAECFTPLPLGQEQCLDGSSMAAPHDPSLDYCVEPVDCRFSTVDSCGGLLFVDVKNDLRGVYVAYAVTNTGTTDYSDVWLTMSGFGDDDSPTAAQLVRVAPFEAVNPQDPMDQWYAAKRIGPLAPGQTATTYVYLEVIDPAQNPSSDMATYPELAVWDGFPAFPLATATNVIPANVDTDTCLDPATGLPQPTLVGNGSCDDGRYGSFTALCLAGTDATDCANPTAVSTPTARAPFSACADPDRLYRRPCVDAIGALEWPFVYADTIQASANKILELAVTDPPAIGGFVDVTVYGDSGQPGLTGDLILGDAGDPEALVGLSPSALGGYYAKGLQLVETGFVFSGPNACGVLVDCTCTPENLSNCLAQGFDLGCETEGPGAGTCIVTVAANELDVVLEDDYPVLYRGDLRFAPRELFPPMPIIPMQYIVSGRQFKHTTVTGVASCIAFTDTPCPGGTIDCEAAYPGMGSWCSTLGTCRLLDTLDPACRCQDSGGTACVVQADCGFSEFCNPATHTCSDIFCLPSPAIEARVTKTADTASLAGGVVGYTLALENLGASPIRLDEVQDRLPGPPDCAAAPAPCGPAAATYVAGSTLVEGASYADPLADGTELLWVGPFDIPPFATLSLSYEVTLPASDGVYRNAALGLVGSLAGSGGTAIDVTGGLPFNLDTHVTDPPAPCATDGDCVTAPANPAPSPDWRCREGACVLPATADVEVVTAFCGDGTLDPGEMCDDGLDNGITVCGCNDICEYPGFDTPCDDGSVCTLGEFCDGAGSCLPGVPIACVDSDPCTLDVCDPAQGCVFPPFTGGELSCGQGQCEHTVTECVDGALQICDPFEGATTEVCDGRDNDCDGASDEFLSCGVPTLDPDAGGCLPQPVPLAPGEGGTPAALLFLPVLFAGVLRRRSRR